MGLTKAASLLLKARDALKDLKADNVQVHTKLASVEIDIKAYNSVLELVKEGLIDPIDVFDKLAEFKEDPSKPALIKQASTMGYSSKSYELGQVTDLGKHPTEDSTSPEEKFFSRVHNIIEDSNGS